MFRNGTFLLNSLRNSFPPFKSSKERQKLKQQFEKIYVLYSEKPNTLLLNTVI